MITSGAWSQHWAEQLQRKIPVHPIYKAKCCYLKRLKIGCLPRMNRVMYLIPRQDGHIVCGSSMADCGFSTAVDEQTQQDILTACLEMVPELEQFPIVQRWAGLRPSSPHGIPLSVLHA
ncbi:MAG: FAD-dependent oxidoreductase [Acinetobacter sp.]